MKIAVMQPYFFPYIGYYQLAFSVDEFVVFDDVNFIKKGYINRNAILSDGERFEFSVPVSKLSQNRKIAEHRYTGEFQKFLKQVESAYRKAPFFSQIYPLVEQVALDKDCSVAVKNSRSLGAVFDYLGLDLKISFASELAIPEHFKAQDRIIEICKCKKASHYHNSIGGRALYQSEAFAKNNIDLKFIAPRPTPYSQPSGEFVPYLSIIDVLMWNEKSKIAGMLKEYDLV